MKCPFCSKTAKKVLSEVLRDGIGRVVYCKNCELGMLDTTTYSSKDIIDYYCSGTYRKTHSPILGKSLSPKEIFKINVPFQGSRVNLIAPYSGKDKSLLEIGCSAGQFLFYANKSYGSIYGYDLNAEEFKYAIKKTGCKILTDDLKVDVICAFQVLEHVSEPKRFIEEYFLKHLKPNGKIIIEVPSLYDPLLYLYDVPTYKKFFFHKAHLWYFTPFSLLKLMNSLGLEGHIFYTQDYNFLNHLNWYFLGKPQKSCTEGLTFFPTLKMKKSCSVAKRDKFDNFLLNISNQYRHFLETEHLTSNITFVGE